MFATMLFWIDCHFASCAEDCGCFASFEVYKFTPLPFALCCLAGTYLQTCDGLQLCSWHNRRSWSLWLFPRFVVFLLIISCISPARSTCMAKPVPTSNLHVRAKDLALLPHHFFLNLAESFLSRLCLNQMNESFRWWGVQPFTIDYIVVCALALDFEHLSCDSA